MQVQSLGQEDTMEGEWQPTPVFLLGASHKQRSLAGYSPSGSEELDMTEAIARKSTSLAQPKKQGFPAEKLKVKVAQSCPTPWDPTEFHVVHGILQARILEWLSFPFSRGSSQPRDRTQVSCIAGGFFTSWATREALPAVSYSQKEKRVDKVYPSSVIHAPLWTEVAPWLQ